VHTSPSANSYTFTGGNEHELDSLGHLVEKTIRNETAELQADGKVVTEGTDSGTVD